jgi:hypothetical protein
MNEDKVGDALTEKAVKAYSQIGRRCFLGFAEPDWE